MSLSDILARRARDKAAGVTRTYPQHENRASPPVRALPVLRPPCVSQGARVPGQPCGSPLLKCERHGDVTARLFPCTGATRCCATCPDYRAAGDAAAPTAVTLDHSGNGIGDGLLGLCAAEGLRATRQPVRYRVGPAARPFVKLFEGWADVGLYARPVPGRPAPGVRQLNADYERDRAAGVPFLARYCRNAGGAAPALPRPADPERLGARGAAFAGAVVLAPFSRDKTRTYPLAYWLFLERALHAAGFATVVLHSELKPLAPFAGAKLAGATAAVVAGVMLSAALVIGCDSGPAHLAGILGRRTLVVCGPIRGEQIYGFYPDVTAVNSGERGWPVPQFVADLALRTLESGR